MAYGRNATRRALPRRPSWPAVLLACLGLPLGAAAAEPAEPVEPMGALAVPDTGVSLDLAVFAPRISDDSPGLRRRAPTTAAFRGSTRFVGGHLMPRMNRQFAGVLPHGYEPGPGMDVAVFHDDLAADAERRAERGARKALRAYLLDATSLDRVAADVRRGADERAASRPDRPVRFRLGVSHGLPRAEMRYRGDRRSLRVTLSAALTAGVDLSSVRRPGNRLSLRYDADDENVRLAFAHTF